MHKIDHSMQFANRGDILDVFSVNMDSPLRIELFDDYVESIRLFSLDTQTSIQSINNINILPASELLLTEEENNNLEAKIRHQAEIEEKQLKGENKDCFLQNINTAIDNIKNSHSISALQKYYGFLQNEHFTLSDYAKDATIILANEEQINNSFDLLNGDADTFIIQEYKKGLTLKDLSYYQNLKSILSKTKEQIKIHEFVGKKDYASFNISSIAGVATKLN